MTSKIDEQYEADYRRLVLEPPVKELSRKQPSKQKKALPAHDGYDLFAAMLIGGAVWYFDAAELIHRLFLPLWKLLGLE